MILGSVAAVTGLISSIFGSNKQTRLNDITNDIAKNQFLEPTAMNVIQGMTGAYEDFDARGNLRTSSMSAVPTVAEPYITSKVIDGQRRYYDVAGNVVSPYGGGATGSGQAPVAGGVTITINALEPQSFAEFMSGPVNSNAVGESLADHLERHDGRAANAIRFIS
jgi:hypothetical protein